MSVRLNLNPIDKQPIRTPVPKEELNKFKTKVTEILIEHLPELNAAYSQLEETKRLIEEDNRGIEAAHKKIEAADKEIEAARKKFEAADKQIALAKKNRQEKLIKQFFSIFNGKASPSEETINNIFNTYLADGSLSVEKSLEGNSYPKINSMKAVTKYLDNNPSIKACDFRSFETEVHDIPTLAEYLKTSTVKAIALKSQIPEAAKESLTTAVVARNGGLKVQYFT